MKRMSIQEAISYFELNIANIPNLGNNQSIESMNQNLSEFKIILKKAYRKVALKNHPDVGGNEEQMKKINYIYKSLMSLKVVPIKPSPVHVYYSYTYPSTTSSATTYSYY